MNRTFIISALFVCMLLSCTGTVSAGTYSGGDGSSETPYLLSSDSDIDELSSTYADWGSYFQLTQNITLVGNHTPIGSGDPQFTGNFDGNGYAIKNMTVYQTGNDAGFFGYTSSAANIHELGVEASSAGVVSTAGSRVGVLVGYNYGAVRDCSATGNVTGVSYVGGLIGYQNSNTVSNCSATGTVTAADDVGGLIGFSSGTVSNCYATGNVISTSSYRVGGLLGFNSGTATNCYATGDATGSGSSDDVGGLVGLNNLGNINNGFATGAATGRSNIGGLVGRNNGGTVNSYCYYSSEGEYTNSIGNLTSYTNFMDFAFVSGASGLNWNASGDIITTATDPNFIWKIDDGSSLPYFQYSETEDIPYSGGSGTVADPYLLSTDSDIDELSATSADWGMNFTLINDITLVGNHTPIGNLASQFTGNFNGSGYAITNLTVYQSTDRVGFFGYAGSTSNIHDLGIETSSEGVVSTGNNVGALVGVTVGTVNNCYATGNVAGASYVGGLAGYSDAAISNSYTTVDVTGSSNNVGGLVGRNNGVSGNVTNCYTTGNATGANIVGCLVGFNGGTVTSSFATGTAAADGSTVGGLIGDNTWGTVYNNWYSGSPTDSSATSSSYSNFTSFAFVSGATGLNWNEGGDIITTEDNATFIWKINDGCTLPFLQYQDIPYSGGSGTADDPYLLSTDSDIDTLSATSDDWDKYFLLARNITLVGNHTPIGSDTPPFTGDFNGNGYTISNLTVYKSSGEMYAGFFGYAETANIHDLRVEASPDGVVLTSNILAGVLIGYQYGGTVSNCSATGNATGYGNYVGGLIGGTDYTTVSNCSATGNAIGLNYVGGLMGNINAGSLSNCSATGNATGSSDVGGLAGICYSTISNCSATGTATGSGNYVGGLVGNNAGSGTVSNSFATGNVTSTGVDSHYTGGLSGYNSGFVSICYATGNVTGSGEVGGLIGESNSIVRNSYATGDVIGSGASVGGLLGKNWDEISNCYATGNATTVSQYVGGLVGWNLGDVSKSFAAGIATGTSKGGLIGLNDGEATVFKSYYSGSPVSGSGTSTSYDNFMSFAYVSYTGLDWNASGTLDVITTEDDSNYIWQINDGQSLPYFQYQDISFIMPGTPDSFTNTTGDSWVNHSWSAGEGDVTDSYNISYDGGWLNGTTNNCYNQTGLSAHAWSNITVYAYNATESTLSDGASDNVQVPNNEIGILNVADITTSEGETINFDINFTDADGDTATFACNQSSLFDNFNTSTGEGSWDIGFSDSGTYYVEFNVSDAYGSVDSQIMTITVANTATIYVGDGSEYDFSSIQDAIDDASEDTTIIVTDGTYNENVLVDKELIIRSENGAASTVVNASVTHVSVASPDHAFYVRAGNVTIDGFNVIGATSLGAAGIYLDDSDNCTITNNIANNNIFGICLSSSNYNTLTGNNASSNERDGIYFSSSNYNTLENNIAMDNSEYGFSFISSSSNTLTTNTAENNSEYDIVTHGVNEIESLTITENDACISFLSNNTEIGIKGNATNSTALSGKINVNGYLTVKINGILLDSIGLNGLAPVTNITVSYDDSSISSSVESSINLYKYINNTWTAVNGTSLDTSSNQLTVTISEGTFGLFRDPNPTPTTPSSSSSSGTRASVSQGQDPTVVVTSVSSVIRVTSGSPVNYDFSDSGTPVLGVSFDSKDDQGLVVAKVQVLSATPEGVPSQSGNIYQMMSIDVGSEGTISSDNADNIMISFKVSKQWIEENNIDVSTIRMSRYHGEQWNDLPTYQEREDGEYFYFYAETPGFSVFEVVGDEVSASSEQVPASASIAEEVEEPVEEKTAYTPGFTAPAGVVFVSLVVLLRRK